MRFLGKPHGIFVLDDSDHNVGSFITKDDICKILYVTNLDLNNLKFVSINGREMANENYIQTMWHKGKILNAPSNKVKQFQISLEELILIKIIKNTYANAIIDHQVQWGQKSIDLKVTINNISKLIDFHGPGHFMPTTRDPYPENPFIRKKQAEDDFPYYEYIIWPYWIHRCSRNVRAIFEESIEGVGAIWSANVHFGKFYFENSAKIIARISNRFKAIRDDGMGYFYEKGENGINKPKHPIIDEIKSGHKNVSLLLPKGFQNRNIWLPKCLQDI